MNKIMAILVILLLPLPLCAMKRIADSELSSISGFASLSISFNQTLNIDAGPLAWGSSYYFSRAVSESAGRCAATFSREDDTITENGEAGGEEYSVSFISREDGGPKSLRVPRLTLKGNKLTYSELNDFDLFSAGYASSFEAVSSIDDQNGRSFSETNPKFIDVRPDGETQLRMYYTGSFNYNTAPRSTVDIWVH
jgi:hypothetical protein